MWPASVYRSGVGEQVGEDLLELGPVGLEPGVSKVAGLEADVEPLGASLGLDAGEALGKGCDERELRVLGKGRPGVDPAEVEEVAERSRTLPTAFRIVLSESLTSGSSWSLTCDSRSLAERTTALSGVRASCESAAISRLLCCDCC